MEVSFPFQEIEFPFFPYHYPIRKKGNFAFLQKPSGKVRKKGLLLLQRADLPFLSDPSPRTYLLLSFMRRKLEKTTEERRAKETMGEMETEYRPPNLVAIPPFCPPLLGKTHHGIPLPPSFSSRSYSPSSLHALKRKSPGKGKFSPRHPPFFHLWKVLFPPSVDRTPSRRKGDRYRGCGRGGGTCLSLTKWDSHHPYSRKNPDRFPGSPIFSTGPLLSCSFIPP
jgi:hypothetical protein